MRNGMLFMQDKVAIEVYGTGMGAVSMAVMALVVGGLAYTFMRVQGVLNKSKAF